ncbi:AarF/ABC1/UbiB kinase family protein [Candidatus Saccharibacteria bacterium]|nr:AarF/ABC1/UbiB kinase family protein [Candidatus Saccharibacteria bacterium]
MSTSQKNSIKAIKRYRTTKLAKLITKTYYLHKRGKDEQAYTIVCNEFMGLGGIYVKFLQGVLLRSTVMRNWHNPEKLRIFENLDSEPIDVVSVLRRELLPENLSQIKSIQPQPFAAGSFGQVYYGIHNNGNPIIIKVLRPMVRELLKHDLKLLSIFTKRFASKLTPNMDMNVESAIKDFISATLRETDYVAEADFANELYEYYKHHKNFIIPKTYMNLCTPNIITQDYIDGISVAQIIKLQEQGVDPAEYVQETLGSDIDTQLETLGFEAINGIFNLERTQGDPHPGNIRLMTNNRVGIIDFGISAKTPPDKAAFFGLIREWNHMYSEHLNIVKLFEQFMRFFVSDLYKALKKLSSMSKAPVENSNFTTEVGKVAQETFSQQTGGQDIGPMLHDGRILQIINQMVNKNNRFGLVMKMEASDILRASQTYITLVESLGRRGVVLPRVFNRVVDQVQKDHPELMHANEDTMSAGEAFEIVSNWLERVANRDPVLFSQLMQKIRLSKVKSEIVTEEVTANA